MGAEPCLCRPDEAAAFFRRQALGRGDKISFRPGSDFKKDDLAAVFADKVQFQMPVTPVAVKDNPAPRPRFRRRGLLSGPPETQMRRVRAGSRTAAERAEGVQHSLPRPEQEQGRLC